MTSEDGIGTTKKRVLYLPRALYLGSFQYPYQLRRKIVVRCSFLRHAIHPFSLTSNREGLGWYLSVHPRTRPLVHTVSSFIRIAGEGYDAFQNRVQAADILTKDL